MSVPSWIHPDDSYTLRDLQRDAGDSSLHFSIETGEVCDSEGSPFVDENGNGWQKDDFE